MKRHTHTFLVEIGTEELPPKGIHHLSKVLSEKIIAEMDTVNLLYKEVQWFSTPRRLAVKVMELNLQEETQKDSIIERRGPSLSRAFDAYGNPTKEVECWARSCGITVSQAERLVTDKGAWLITKLCVRRKQSMQALLCSIVKSALRKLPIKKLMRWGDKDIQFIRPVHTITLMLDEHLISCNILGMNTSCVLKGHRFMGESEIYLDHADHYPKILLKRGRVIADYDIRKNNIKMLSEEAASKIGGKVDTSDDILEEVTELVEWPVVLTGHFDEEFLLLPIEVLRCVIQGAQKNFIVYTENGRKLLPYFIFVSNIESNNSDTIITGNEKSVHARLEEASLFFKIDCQKRLEDRLPSLSTVILQKDRGTLLDKSKRIQSLSGWIASQIGANVQHARRAGLLSKCDLQTNMVFQLNELKGVMGMYYARHDGEEESVALAQKEQYQPCSYSDKVPTTLVSCSVSIADKIDNLVSIFSIGQHPQGTKDPFFLRRSAFGILRIIIEKQLTLDLKRLTEEAMILYGNNFPPHPDMIKNQIIHFIFGRIRTWYKEQGYSDDLIQSVLACFPTILVDLDNRIRALSNFKNRNEKEYESLIFTNKRIVHMLRKSDVVLKQYAEIHIHLLIEPSEIKMEKELSCLGEKVKRLLNNGCYQEALLEISHLRPIVDSFFENVMVMANERIVRINRLSLLNKLRRILLKIADFSYLQTDLK